MLNHELGIKQVEFNLNLELLIRDLSKAKREGYPTAEIVFTEEDKAKIVSALKTYQEAIKGMIPAGLIGIKEALGNEAALINPIEFVERAGAYNLEDSIIKAATMEGLKWVYRIQIVLLSNYDTIMQFKKGA